MNWSLASDKGLVRPSNEDSLCAEPGLGLFAVADGMGGHRAGEVASQTAIAELVRYLKENLSLFPNPADALVNGVQAANRLVFHLSSSYRSLRGMGTTLTAALVRGGELFWAHVGDSRLYLLRGGELVQLTEDHSLVRELVRRGGLREEQARFHPHRSVLTRALGIEPEVRVDSDRLVLRSGDRLLLCTDGLTEHLSDEEIAAVASDCAAVAEAVGRLVEMALRRGGTDNISIILLAVGE